MLFNSYTFILGYLPLVLTGFFVIARLMGAGPAAAWLALASLVLYGWWNPWFVLLLLASIGFNFAAGRTLLRFQREPRKVRLILVSAVCADLALLGVFKYANFFIGIANDLDAGPFARLDWVLPLGISFFTFTQIAFLVDVSRGLVSEYRFVHYLLFVTWFPHLIAGPIIHHAQVMPQFTLARTYVPQVRLLSAGLTLFCLGLGKKVLLADSLADYAIPVFDAADAGRPLTGLAAWTGVVAYSLQLYFDFSGYSDMACGLSLMFGIRLPINFESPYKAWNIVEFWRRWHMTLSKFLRDYLYVPLGGNRHGPVRRYLNLMITMLLGGLWHGASWNFVVWGAVHGALLSINHGWHQLRGAWGLGDAARPGPIGRVIGVALTLTAVMLAWIPFRCADLAGSARMLAALGDLRALASPGDQMAAFAAWMARAPGDWFAGLPPTMSGIDAGAGLPLVALGLAIVMLAPNSIEIVGRGAVYREQERGGPSAVPAGAVPGVAGLLAGARATQRRWRWRPRFGWAVFVGVVFAVSFLNLSRVSPFLYFQF